MSIIFEHYKQLSKIVNQCTSSISAGGETKWWSSVCDAESCYLSLRCIK